MNIVKYDLANKVGTFTQKYLYLRDSRAYSSQVLTN